MTAADGQRGRRPAGAVAVEVERGGRHLPLLLLLLLPEPVRWCAVEWCGVVCCVCCSGPVQALDV